MIGRIAALGGILLITGAELWVPSPSEPIDASGRWAMIQIYPEIAVLPFAGEVERTSVVAQFVAVTQNGGLVEMLDTYCFTLVDDGTPLVATEIPESFMTALRPSSRIGRVEGSPSGWRFTQDEYVEVRGARLENPARDPLPTDLNDPRLFDQDEDGFPGMSVNVTVLGFLSGRTYVVQRVRYRLDGEFLDDRTIRGTIAWSTEQYALGASMPLLQLDSNSRPHPDPARSVFLMVRADPSWTCATLRERLPDWMQVASGTVLP